MSESEFNSRINDLNTEDFIWVIYLFIIILSTYSNSIERRYFTEGNPLDKEKYRKIIILIFSILIFVYLYFLKDSIDSLKELKPTDSDKKKSLTYLSFIGSLLIAISGFIFLYIAFADEDLDVELAFN